MYKLINGIGVILETPSREVASIADILTQAGLLFTWVFQQLATVVTTITANPLLMVGFLITLVGLVVGMFRRLVNVQ